MAGMIDYTELGKKFLSKYNIILLGTVGSRLSGFHTDDSDTDYMGVFVEPIQDIVGFAQNDTAIFRTAEVREGRKDAPSQAGDVDITLFGLRKFLKLCLAGNPTAISLLYNPRNFIEIYSAHGNGLQQLNKYILSKNIGRAFTGFINSNMIKASKYKAPRFYQDDSALANVKQAIILSWMLYDILNGHQAAILREPGREKTIKNVIEGNYGFNDVENIMRNNIDRCSLYTAHLEDTPNYGVVETWMLNTYKQVWNGEVQETSQQLGFDADQAREAQGPGEGDRPQVEDPNPF